LAWLPGNLDAAVISPIGVEAAAIFLEVFSIVTHCLFRRAGESRDLWHAVSSPCFHKGDG